MNAPLTRAFVLVVALLVTSGCGANGALGYDPYAAAYGSGTGSSYGADYGSSYGSSYGSDYGSSYGSDYGSSSGASYGSSYGSGYGSTTGGTYGGASASPGATTSGSYGDYGASYGDDAVVRANASARPEVTPPPAAPSTLSAWVAEVKEPSFFGRLRGGKITAKVEVENPSDRTLTGRVRVRFLDSGNPTGVIQTRRVTLAPKEKQVLTFSADAGRLDDAEASVETEGAAAGRGVVADRSAPSGP